EERCLSQRGFDLSMTPLLFARQERPLPTVVDRNRFLTRGEREPSDAPEYGISRAQLRQVLPSMGNLCTGGQDGELENSGVRCRPCPCSLTAELSQQPQRRVIRQSKYWLRGGGQVTRRMDQVQ